MKNLSPLPLWAAVPVAASAGIILDAAFPDRGWWPLAFVGIALNLAVLIGRRLGAAFLVGFVAGGTFYLAHIEWASLFLGPLPMAALVVLQALFFGVGGMAITLAYRWVPLAYATLSGRLAVLPITVAGLWVFREGVASTWPYGGFSWGRVAMSQSDSPITSLFGWLGVSGVSFAMVLLVAICVEAVRYQGSPQLGRAIAPLALAAVMTGVPSWPTPTIGTLRVAAVQGNGPAGYFDSREPGDLTAAQLGATRPLFGERADVVLWPEGSTDDSPLTDPYTAAVFDEVSRQMGAPLVGWAVTERNDRTYNTEILWTAEDGATDYYDKKHPVPFGEYVPNRDFWRPFAPDLIDLVQRDYTPGTTDPIFDIGGVLVGINICFDVVDDRVLRASVLQGATAIFSSSNNADFGRSDQSAQQLAIARIRAMELGRSVVNVSTVGLTAAIGPDGEILQQLPWFTAASLVQDVSLIQTVTPAALFGGQIEFALAGVAMALLVGSASYPASRRKLIDSVDAV
ncbi:MAG: apolipoprotein N-acyltransferase [Salinibacterium sp.]|nr:apolipoprotein N-acyltransferase [Salinibacterium sp.]